MPRIKIITTQSKLSERELQQRLAAVAILILTKSSRLEQMRRSRKDEVSS